MNEELSVYGSAGINGSGYSDLLITDLSRKLDDLFGFNYQSKMLSYLERSETLKLEDIDEPEIFLHWNKISLVSQRPVLGLTGEINTPVSREVDYNFRSARLLMVAYRESEKVVDYFSGLSKKVGFFFALPYDEILTANNGLIEGDIEVALKEGYARTGITTHLDGNPIKFIELTDKFYPLEKRLQN